MNVFVVGANGLVGSNMVHEALQRGYEVAGSYHSEAPDFDIPLVQFDLAEYAAFDEVLDAHDPDVVVNCAAMTDVDGCEREPERAHVLNGEAPGGLAARCVERGVEFVHVSTDYVFDGTAEESYDESAEPNPIQVYGESKLAGERAVQREDDDAVITRLSFVYGVHRSSGELTGFPAWVRGRLDAGEKVPLFTDQWVTPTRAGQAAGALLDLVERGASRLFHVACRSCVTPYEFGEVIAEEFGYDPRLLVEGSTEDVDREAARPSYTCLEVEKVESGLEREQPSIHQDMQITQTVK